MLLLGSSYLLDLQALKHHKVLRATKSVNATCFVLFLPYRNYPLPRHHLYDVIIKDLA